MNHFWIGFVAGIAATVSLVGVMGVLLFRAFNDSKWPGPWN